MSLPTLTKLASNSLPARYGHTSVFLPSSNQVIVLSGKDGVNLLNDIWSISTVTNDVTQLKPSGTFTGRYWHTSNYLDGEFFNSIVTIGGFNGGDASDVFIFDILKNAISTLVCGGQSFLGRVSHTSSYVENGEIIVIGGRNDFTRLSDVWKLKMTNNTSGFWTKIIPIGFLPAIEQHSAGFDLSNNIIYILGGYTKTNGVYALNTKTFVCSQVSSSILNIGGASTQFIKGLVYVFLGANTISRDNSPEIYTFNPSTGSISTVSTDKKVSPPRQWLSSAYDTFSNSVYLIAGYDSNWLAINDIWKMSNLPLTVSPSITPTNLPTTFSPTFISTKSPTITQSNPPTKNPSFSPSFSTFSPSSVISNIPTIKSTLFSSSQSSSSSSSQSPTIFQTSSSIPSSSSSSSIPSSIPSSSSSSSSIPSSSQSPTIFQTSSSSSGMPSTSSMFSIFPTVSPSNEFGSNSNNDTSLSTGTLVGIVVGVVVGVLLLSVVIYFCIKQSKNGKGDDSQLFSNSSKHEETL